MKNYNQRNQAVMMRDMIDMYRDYSTDSSAIEYLSSFAFNIARIVEENNLVNERLNWDELFSFFDQKYHTINTNPNAASDVNDSKINNLYVAAKNLATA
jgi:hypothetical protein